MVRITKDYDERYTEFLDVGATLFFTEGYEATSVQRIIRAVGVAKGTFYYYFSSKDDLLGAVIERQFAEILPTLQPILEDTTRTAPQKLADFIAAINQWKIANKPLMLETVRVLYRDENVLLREKLRQAGLAATTPLVAEIIRQGVAAGRFDVRHPLATAEVILAITNAFSEALVPLVLNGHAAPDAAAMVERRLAACNLSIARVLGMQSSTFSCIDRDVVLAWFSDDPSPLEA